MQTADFRKSCYWLSEAAAALGPIERVKQLDRAITADVCIVGGGYLGLWTALRLRELAPDTEVVVLEQGLCGEGASGRNGGFILSWWAKLQTLVELTGAERAVRLAQQSVDAIDEIGSFCEQEGIDAHFRQGGWIWTTTSRAQVGAWRETVELAASLGTQPFEVLTENDLTARVGQASMGGAFESKAAIVQPARLARGLRDVALRRGVKIYENSPVLRIEGRGRVDAGHGAVDAGTTILATNAWAARQKQLRRAIVAVSSDVVATEPIPAVLEKVGWTGGEAISNSRLMVDYYRTTEDGRIVFGRAGGALARAGRIGSKFDCNPSGCDLAAAALARLIPEARSARITHRWSGAVDRTFDGLPYFGRLGADGRLLFGVGFSGNGVGPTLVGAKILASTALGRDDEWSASALNGGIRKRFPPEPVRYLGGDLVRRAVSRKESLEDDDRSVPRAVAMLAAQAPAGFFKVGETDDPEQAENQARQPGGPTIV